MLNILETLLQTLRNDQSLQLLPWDLAVHLEDELVFHDAELGPDVLVLRTLIKGGLQVLDHLLELPGACLLDLGLDTPEDVQVIPFLKLESIGECVLELHAILPQFDGLRAERVQFDLDALPIGWIVEVDKHVVLRDALVFVQDVRDVLLLQGLEDRCGLRSHLQHGPLGSVVGLHAREVPAGELFEVDGAVVVQVQVLEGVVELPLRELMAQILGQLAQLVLVNGAAPVLVELPECPLDLVSFLGFIRSGELLDLEQEGRGRVGCLRGQVGRLSAESVLEMVHQEAERAAQGRTISLHRLAQEDVDDRHLRVVAKVLALLLNCVLRESLEVREADEVVGVLHLAVLELGESRGLH